MSHRNLRFLFWCANEHLSFRVPEFEALAKVFNISLNWVEKNTKEPWVILDLNSEIEAKKLISRSISTKYCIELWADGESYDELHQNLKSLPKKVIDPYCGENISFKIYVEAFMKKLSVRERVERIEAFSYLPIQGPVKMKDPDVVMSNFEFFGFDHNNLPKEPLRLFFGRFIGEGQRDLITKLSIKKRKFIGNTTMDPQLSLLMANLAAISPGDLTLDPFVGTGSLLIAAAQFGSYVLGTDIDFLMLHARTRPSRKGQKKRDTDESLRANFEQYGLQSRYLDIAVSDFSRPLWRSNPNFFKAVITDPPYGIREPTAKVGTTKDNVIITEEQLKHHIPQKIEYSFSEIFTDLLNFGATHLTVGGRLVFWIPVLRDSYSEDSLPTHPNLKLVANCEQVLSSHTSRRLLVMEKVPLVDRDSGESSAKTLLITPSQFREKFFKQYKDVPRRERKERLKKYGHLNIKDINIIEED